MGNICSEGFEEEEPRQLNRREVMGKKMRGQPVQLDDDDEEANNKNMFQVILERLEATGEKFTDTEFPATATSLITDWNEDHDEVREQAADWKSIQWLRADQIPELNDREGPMQIFKGGIEPNDIQQRALGDCYFLSVLSALAENPDRVRKLFVSSDLNANDVFGVRVTKNGESRLVCIDATFPCKNQKVCFSTAHGNELWVLLLEKVWAKLHGDYCRIIGGLCHETFRDMTGAPGFMYSTREVEDIWNKMKLADQKNYMLAGGISANNQQEVEQMKDLGLISGHAYSVIACAEVQTANGVQTQIVQVRNPWGSFEWIGDWCDESPLWTQEAKDQVDLVVDKNDGTFWMSFEDFSKYFSMLFISKYVDSYHFNNLKVPIKKDGHYLFQMHIESSGEYTIAISQKDKRCFPLSSTYNYSSVTVAAIYDSDNDMVDLEYKQGTQGFMQRDTYLEFSNLPKGEYWVLVKVDWHESFAQFENEMTLNINSYGWKPVHFHLDTDEDKANFIEVMLLSQIKNLAQSEYKQPSDEVQVFRYTTKAVENGFFYTYIVNRDKNYTYTEEVNYNTFEGMTIVDNHGGRDDCYIYESSYKMVVAPGQGKLVIIEVNAGGYSMSSSKKAGFSA